LFKIWLSWIFALSLPVSSGLYRSSSWQADESKKGHYGNRSDSETHILLLKKSFTADMLPEAGASGSRFPGWFSAVDRYGDGLA
jgi:hypothetical protein